MELDLKSGEWINPPAQYTVSSGRVQITTDSGTDFWQRSYYGFRNDNAPALLFSSEENFSFTSRVRFQYRKQFDQCGPIIYQDSENWFKASIEYENGEYSRLGSVVTNGGYSDWATRDISLPPEIWYRLSRRGPDFLIEYSLNGNEFCQMRVFHLQILGETTEAMGKADPPQPPAAPVRFGFYACSPVESSFTADFSEIRFEPSVWKAHS